MVWAVRMCVLAHRAMDVPKKVSLQAMLTLLSEFLGVIVKQNRVVRKWIYRYTQESR